MRSRPRSFVRAAAAFCMIAALSACAGDEGPAPTSGPLPGSEPAPASTAPVVAPSTDGTTLTSEQLDLCLDRSVEPAGSFFLGRGSPAPLDHLRAAVADVRRSLLSAVPERVARLAFDATVPSLTVVPAAGEDITDDTLTAAFSALTGIDVDAPAALGSVRVVPPEGRPFSEQCAAYTDAWALMESNPEEGPMLVGLGFDLERGVITAGATDPDHPRFAALAAHGDVVEITEEQCCAVGE